VKGIVGRKPKKLNDANQQRKRCRYRETKRVVLGGKAHANCNGKVQYVNLAKGKVKQTRGMIPQKKKGENSWV